MICKIGVKAPVGISQQKIEALVIQALREYRDSMDSDDAPLKLLTFGTVRRGREHQGESPAAHIFGECK